MKYSFFLFTFSLLIIPLAFANPVKTNIDLVPVVLESKNNSCHFCVEVVDILSDEVHHANRSINQIIKVVESICNISGPIVRPECDHILNDISYILNMISKGFNSTEICHLIHLCNTDSCIQFNKCHFCTFLTSQIRNAISLGNSTFNDLLSLIDDICRMTHTPVVSQECHFFIVEMKNIENWIMGGFNDTQICDKLHFCNTTVPQLESNSLEKTPVNNFLKIKDSLNLARIARIQRKYSH